MFVELHGSVLLHDRRCYENARNVEIVDQIGRPRMRGLTIQIPGGVVFGWWGWLRSLLFRFVVLVLTYWLMQHSVGTVCENGKGGKKVG